jgi:hypothetical protein
MLHNSITKYLEYSSTIRYKYQVQVQFYRMYSTVLPPCTVGGTTVDSCIRSARQAAYEDNVEYGTTSSRVVLQYQVSCTVLECSYTTFSTGSYNQV